MIYDFSQKLCFKKKSLKNHLDFVFNLCFVLYNAYNITVQQIIICYQPYILLLFRILCQIRFSMKGKRYI